MFIIGFLDDLKINIKPSMRLFLMIFSFFLYIYLPIKILNIDIPFFFFESNNHFFINFCTFMFFICY